MTTEHDIEIELSGGRILKTSVKLEWDYERNPGDKERAQYRGEDDGYTRQDEPKGTSPITIDGVAVDGRKALSKEDDAALEKAIDDCEPDYDGGSEGGCRCRGDCYC